MVIKVNESAKILTNVQTFRDCALQQWSVRYKLRHVSWGPFLESPENFSGP